MEGAKRRRPATTPSPSRSPHPKRPPRCYLGGPYHKYGRNRGGGQWAKGPVFGCQWGQRSRIFCRTSLLPLGRKRAVASITSANFGRTRVRSRSIFPGGCGFGIGALTGASRRSATWESERIWSSMSSVQSVRATGVDAMHTSPLQWLKTIVADSGCHVARRYWSPPRTSGRNTRLGGTSATN